MHDFSKSLKPYEFSSCIQVLWVDLASELIISHFQAERLAKCTGEMERIEWEMDISIHGIGVSLVNNDENVRKELAYLSIVSSNIGEFKHDI